jgi:hypothetical protein
VLYKRGVEANMPAFLDAAVGLTTFEIRAKAEHAGLVF